jgi:hypothetical protein
MVRLSKPTNLPWTPKSLIRERFRGAPSLPPRAAPADAFERPTAIFPAFTNAGYMTWLAQDNPN